VRLWEVEPPVNDDYRYMTEILKTIDQKSKIETIKNPKGSEISFLPQRGGIVTSIKLSGREIRIIRNIGF